MQLTLDAEFLRRFDRRLRELGAPIVEVWAPGCTDDEIDAQFGPLGIDLPEEARAWWRWHNGTSDEAPMQHRSIGGRTVFSVDVAAAAYRDERDDVRQLFGLEGLVPPVGDKPSVFFGCAGPRGEPVPIYVQHDIAEPRVVLPSIRSMLEAWLDLIDAGAWQLGADGEWEFCLDRVPQHLRDAGLYSSARRSSSRLSRQPWLPHGRRGCSRG